MKKIFYKICLLLLPVAGIGQQTDTVLIYTQIDSLLQIADDHLSEGAYQQMYDLADIASNLARKKLGSKDNKYADCLVLKYEAMYYLGKYEEAIKLAREEADIRQLNLGILHPDYGNSLNMLAHLYRKMGTYKKAELLYLEALSIYEKVLGKEHPSYATSLSNLAELYNNMGTYEKAELLYLEALSIYEKVLGKEHPSYANSLNGLAGLYDNMGNYEKAEPLYLETISIDEKTLGKEHPSYATSLSNLAALYIAIGNYEKVEPLYLEALSIYEKVLGKEHPYYANGLNSLAGLYDNMGNYEKTEPLYLEALSIFEKVLGKEHPWYIGSLNNLAILYKEKGNYEKAEPLYLEALSNYEKSLGKEHPSYANSLLSLAILYNAIGTYEKAEPLYLEALSIFEKSLGKEHPRYANSLISLAILYKEMGNYEKAEPLYLEALSSYEKSLGKEHPSYATSLNGLAKLYHLTKNYTESSPYFCSANDLGKTLLRRATNHLSAIELQKYLLRFEQAAARFASFIHESKLDSLAGKWYDNNLFYKGFLLGNALRVEQLATNTSDSIQEEYFQWKGYQRRLSDEYSKPIANRENVAELEEKANRLEKELIRNIPELKNVSRQVDWQQVRDQLTEGEATIEFTHFQYFTPTATDSTYYVALVIRPGDQAPQPIFLFEEKELDLLLELKGARRADYVNELYSLMGRGGVVLNEANKKSLYEMIWEPLMAVLTDVKTIYYSPSGLLHRINIGAIAIEEEENMASQFELIQLNSTRSLVVPSPLKELNNQVLLYGGIQYDSLAQIGLPTGERGATWSYLKGSEREVHNLEGLLKKNELEPTLLTGVAATEESFKGIGTFGATSPRVLHIATHGYFFPDPAKTTKAGEPVFKVSERPMLRSGLILAGGNHTWMNTQPNKTAEDGILTALEISQMNLRNTELVVLSACETGLGEIQGNEGVYGLQRAFKIAGAKYIIMSLWQVPDKQTSNLMLRFYSKWLEDQMSIRAAFASAQQEMSEMGFDPYFWAGFVLVE